MSLRHRAVEV